MEYLEQIYINVSDWLKFAESKHAGVFAAWVAIFIALLSSSDYFNISQKAFVIISVICLIGVLINVISFFPFLNRFTFLKERCRNKYSHYSGSAIFYQSIFVDTYSNNPEESINKYQQILKEKSNLNFDDNLSRDYLLQIIQMSTVASLKIYLFELSIKYILFFISAIVIFALILMFFNFV